MLIFAFWRLGLFGASSAWIPMLRDGLKLRFEFFLLQHNISKHCELVDERRQHVF